MVAPVDEGKRTRILFVMAIALVAIAWFVFIIAVDIHGIMKALREMRP